MYPDNTQYTLHDDGTKIISLPNGKIIVEHADYATVTIDNKVLLFYEE